MYKRLVKSNRRKIIRMIGGVLLLILFDALLTFIGKL
jgi:hypothetical protein